MVKKKKYKNELHFELEAQFWLILSFTSARLHFHVCNDGSLFIWKASLVLTERLRGSSEGAMKINYGEESFDFAAPPLGMCDRPDGS